MDRWRAVTCTKVASSRLVDFKSRCTCNAFIVLLPCINRWDNPPQREKQEQLQDINRQYYVSSSYSELRPFTISHLPVGLAVGPAAVGSLGHILRFIDKQHKHLYSIITFRLALICLLSQTTLCMIFASTPWLLDQQKCPKVALAKKFFPQIAWND